MEIPGNLHLLIFVAVCVLFTTTECATRIVNCPDGNLTIYVGTEGNLTCEGYSVAQITWEFKSGQSSYSTIGRCTSSSTCDLEPTFNTIFDLTPISGVSSWLNLTTKFTSSPKNATFSCDGEECFVIIDEPPTTPEEKEPGGLSGGEIAGIVVGCIALVAIIAGVTAWLKIKEKFCFETTGNGRGSTTPMNGSAPDKPPNPSDTATAAAVPADGSKEIREPSTRESDVSPEGVSLSSQPHA